MPRNSTFVFDTICKEKTLERLDSIDRRIERMCGDKYFTDYRVANLAEICYELTELVRVLVNHQTPYAPIEKDGPVGR